VVTDRSIDDLSPGDGERDPPAPSVRPVETPLDEGGRFQPVKTRRHPGGREHDHLREVRRPHLERRARAAQGGQDVELADGQPVGGERRLDRGGRVRQQSGEPSEGQVVAGGIRPAS
jgi:hypothetical protein